MRNRPEASGVPGEPSAPELPVRPAWSFSGLRLVLLGASIPLALVVAVVVWAVSRSDGNPSARVAGETSAAAALDCSSSRDSWRWACQKDKPGAEPRTTAAARPDPAVTGSVEPTGRRRTASAQATATEPKSPSPPARAEAAGTRAPASPEPGRPAVAAKAGEPDHQARTAEPAAGPKKPVASGAAPAGEGSAAPSLNAPTETRETPRTVASSEAAVPRPEQVAAPRAVASPATTGSVARPDTAAPPEETRGPWTTPPSAPAARAAEAAPPPPAAPAEAAAVQRQSDEGTSAAAAVPRKRTAAVKRAEPPAAEPRRAAAPKAEKPAQVARRPSPVRQAARTVVEEDDDDEPAVAPRPAQPLRMRAARARAVQQAAPLGPDLRITSVQTHLLADGRVVTVNVRPPPEVVRRLIARHMQAHTSPRSAPPYWDW